MQRHIAEITSIKLGSVLFVELFQMKGGFHTLEIFVVITFTGIVTLTRIWQTGQHENQNPQLPTSPVSL
jgi:heme/copper-type cytochrome/quinol oxidase subunit 3